MNKTLSLRQTCKDDWKTLSEWRNSPSTYENYHTSQPVNETLEIYLKYSRDYK